MSNRKKIPEWIDRFNNGELSGEELTAFLEMVQHDPRLSEEVRLDMELNSILTDEDLIELREKIRSIADKNVKSRGSRRKFYLMAASFLLLIGMGLLFFYFRGTRPSNIESVETNMSQKNQSRSEEMPDVQKKDPTVSSNDIGNKINTKQKSTNLLASFEKNPSFENLIGATRYTGNFRMISPLTDHRFRINEVIQFEWILGGTEEIKVQIFDNRGISVLQSGTIEKNIYSIQKGALKQGLFYFKILRGDDILYFGKFTIE